MSDQFELEAESAVLKLTKPWTDVVMAGRDDTYTPVEHEALLVMLSREKGASLGRTAAGRGDPSGRVPLSMDAVVLWNHIETTVRRQFRALSKSQMPPSLTTGVQRLHGLLRAGHASGQILDSTYLQGMRDFKRWSDRIWTMLNTPHDLDLEAPCPQEHCGATKVLDDSEKPVSALVAYWRQGQEPEAKCRSCGHRWVGRYALLGLGEDIGAVVDAETMRELDQSA